MSDIAFNALDLNLLSLLDVLLEERSATRAGERLGLSQSAVSHALGRLRYALKDTVIMLIPMLLVLAALIIWPSVSLFLPRLIVPEMLK